MSPIDDPTQIYRTATDPASLPAVAITIGDVNGIGIEVLAKALRAQEVRAVCRPLIVGNHRLIDDYIRLLGFDDVRVDAGELVVSDLRCPIVEIPSDAALRPGAEEADAGKLAGDAIVRATEMTLGGEAAAMVTMPISKAALHAGGYDFPGHTEMIASITGGEPMMVLMTEGLRVALVTIHVPLVRVPSLITRSLVRSRLGQVERMLRRDFGCGAPTIAVLGLNPHAGEGGAIGTEEIETIGPALAEARAAGIAADGPLPADGFFARFVPGRYDAVLAMYHDQGLIPLKFFARGGGVNFTADLPIVRTSPDHGVAYGIAGQGIAEERSTVEAITAAVEIARRRAGASR
jgi:4-hydroxythreonine-4-phosphate dehydrogenase